MKASQLRKAVTAAIATQVTANDHLGDLMTIKKSADRLLLGMGNMLQVLRDLGGTVQSIASTAGWQHIQRTFGDVVYGCEYDYARASINYIHDNLYVDSKKLMWMLGKKPATHIGQEIPFITDHIADVIIEHAKKVGPEKFFTGNPEIMKVARMTEDQLTMEIGCTMLALSTCSHFCSLLIDEKAFAACPEVSKFCSYHGMDVANLYDDINHIIDGHVGVTATFVSLGTIGNTRVMPAAKKVYTKPELNVMMGGNIKLVVEPGATFAYEHVGKSAAQAAMTSKLAISLAHRAMAAWLSHNEHHLVD